MNNFFKALLYRNLLIYKNIFLFSLLLICWCFINLDLQRNDQIAYDADLVLQVYVLLIILQFQSVFAHSMIDDRVTQFRNLYKTMGLPKLHYLVSQFSSFVLIILFALVAFFLIELGNNYYFELVEEPFGRQQLQRFVWQVFFGLMSTLVTMMSSNLFKSPSTGRDLNIVVHLSLIMFCCYFYL